MSIAIWNWVAQTDINNGGTDYSITWTRYNRGAGGPTAEHFPVALDDQPTYCTLLVSEINFNSYYSDANAGDQYKMGSTATHELSHRVLFLHDTSTSTCNPDTITLGLLSQRYTGTCTWYGPRSVDEWWTNYYFP